MIAILLAPVYLLANYYLLRRTMGWVKAWFPFFRSVRHWVLPVAVQAFLACSIVIAFFLPEGRARRVMKLIGNYWLGVLLYVLLAVITADLLRLLLGYVLPFRHIFVTTQMHRIAGCLCALAILTASLWGVVNARIIHVTPYDVTVEKQVAGMDEMKVVLVADLHLGYNIGEKQMERMVEKINEQDADLVVIAGDIFDNEWEAVDDPDGIAATLRGIRSKYGVYACYGNHDIEEKGNSISTAVLTRTAPAAASRCGKRRTRSRRRWIKVSPSSCSTTSRRNCRRLRTRALTWTSAATRTTGRCSRATSPSS